MNIITARRYVTVRERPLTPEEADTRRIAYALKLAEEADETFRQAGAELAALVDAPCVLVPVPDSQGGTAVNGRLCREIARNLGPGCRVRDCLYRVAPVEFTVCPPPREARAIAGGGKISMNNEHP